MKNLLLFNFGRVKYGVWEDDVPSIREGRQLLRLPLSPPAFAGLAIIDDRSATLADLAACLGLSPLTGSQKGLFLLIDTREKIAGFAVESAPERVSVPPGSIFPMPDYVLSDVVNTCIAHQSEVVPLIDLHALYERIRLGNPDPPKGKFSAPPIDHAGQDSVAGVRSFTAGNELFAVPAGDVGQEAVPAGTISPIAQAPHYLAGLAYHDGAVIPVIHLAKRMRLRAQGGGRMMLVADINGSRFGFLVDAENGTLSKQEFSALPQPLLSRSPWMESAVVSRGEILPLVDLGALLSTPAEAGRDENLAERYSPSSAFPLQFGRGDADVVEFSLLGARHALPKVEVKDVLPPVPIRAVPNVRPIVIGIAEQGGELLPVLDLAVIFGRRSVLGKDWRTLRVENGDFHALVVTEKVFGERRLPADAQRPVPLVLPHGVVYGCYLDAGMVKLILNVEALTVYFDRELAGEMAGAMSPEMAGARAGIVHGLMEPAPEPAMAGTGAGLPHETVVASKDPDSLTRPVTSEETESPSSDEDQAEKAIEPETPFAAVEQDANFYAEAEEARLKAHEEAETREEEEARKISEEEARLRAEALAGARAEEEARLQAEARARAEEEARRKAEAETRVKSEAEARAMAEAEKARAEAEAETRASAEEEQRRQAEEKLKAEEDGRTQAAQQLIQEAEAISWEEVELRAAPSEKPETEESAIKPQPLMHQEGRASRSQGDDAGSFRKALVYAGIAALFFGITLYSSPLKQNVQAPVSVKSHAGIDGPGKTVSQTAEPEAPLVLEIPAGRPTPESTIYIVRKGDTLWSIAERFTGDPLNYPRVARDNSIATPDLIFPKQRIRLETAKQ